MAEGRAARWIRMNHHLGTSSRIASPLAGLGEGFWLDLPTQKRGASDLRASGATKSEPVPSKGTKSEPDPSIDSFHAIALAARWIRERPCDALDADAAESEGEDGFVGEDAVEGGAADAELAGGAELVVVVEVEDILDVVLDDGVERQVDGVEDGPGRGRRFGLGGDGEVFGADDAILGLKERALDDAGELADVAWPVVLEEPGERAGSEGNGALLVAGADAVEEGLGEGGDVFFALAEGRHGETHGGETEGEVGHEKALGGHLAERDLGRGDKNGAAGRAILEGFENAEEESLAGRGEQVDAVEVDESGHDGRVGLVDQPLAGVVALEGGARQGRVGMHEARQGLLAGAALAFNGGQLHVGRDHFGLEEEFSPGGVDADDLGVGRQVDVEKLEGGRG